MYTVDKVSMNMVYFCSKLELLEYKHVHEMTINKHFSSDVVLLT